MIKLLLKVVGVYGVFFVISVLIATAVLHAFQVKEVMLQVLAGYAFGLVGCIPSTIISLGIVYREVG